MAQIRYRANLSAKDFVFMSQDWGRSVVLKQYDQNFSRQIVSPTDPDKDIGIPQIFYGHNIMPSAQGFQSVGIGQILPSTGLGVGEKAYQILPSTANNQYGYIQVTFVSSTSAHATYNIYTYQPGISVGWEFRQQVLVPIQFDVYRFTVAQINGLTYLYAPGVGCYSWGGVTWSAVPLTGLTPTDIIGITASFGYMIAWSGNAVAWSSTLSPTDFTPSLITGAGGGSIQGLKGGITSIVHHIFGFVAFSYKNCVAGVYSGNARYPFNFREIIGGGGLSGNSNLIDIDSDSGNLYAYTTAGLQICSVTQAQVVHPEVTNFIGGSRFEDFDDIALTFSNTDITPGSMGKQIAVIANRYLVISYGILNTFPQTFSHALVYDISMKRWGKIKFTHVQAVEYIGAQNNGTQDAARTSFCLLAPLGQMYEVDFSQMAGTGGTIILGKYQHARDRLLTLQQVDLEFIPQTAAMPTVNLLPTYDGKTFQASVPLTPISNTGAPQYPCRTTGMNISIIVQGIFRLDSLMLIYNANGRR